MAGRGEPEYAAGKPAVGRHGPGADLADDLPRVANRPGFAHIAFAVDSVAEAREEVLSHGGTPVGDVVTVHVSATARVTWCYVKDPEGNTIELQAWS